MAVNRKRATHRGGRVTSVGSQNAARRQGVAAARKQAASRKKPKASPSKPKPSARDRVRPANSGKPINSGSAKRQQAITQAVNRNR